LIKNDLEFDVQVTVHRAKFI